MASATLTNSITIVSRSAFVSGTKVRVARPNASSSRTAAFSVRAEERPLWFPGSTPPAYLDGTLAADYGFDPFGLASTPKLLSWYTYAEIIHCRWAMWGAAGIFIPDLLTNAGVLNLPTWFNAGTQEYFLDTLTLTAVEVAFFAFSEAQRWAELDKETEKGSYPGFDPLNLGGGDAAAVKKMRAKEIANGRLAMLACLGAFVQGAYTGASPAENLFAHLADPFHVNFFESL